MTVLSSAPLRRPSSIGKGAVMSPDAILPPQLRRKYGIVKPGLASITIIIDSSQSLIVQPQLLRVTRPCSRVLPVFEPILDSSGALRPALFRPPPPGASCLEFAPTLRS